MNKVEKYIKDNTRKDSNQLEIDEWGKNGVYNHWLTPDQARSAVEIAREEIYEWLSNNVFEDKYLDLRKMRIGNAFYGYKVDTLINDLKQAMKDET